MVHEWNWTLLLGLIHFFTFEENFSIIVMINLNMSMQPYFHCILAFPVDDTCCIIVTISTCSPLHLVSPSVTIYCVKESNLTVTEGDGALEFTATQTRTVGGAGCIGVTVMDISTQGRAPLYSQFTL